MSKQNMKTTGLVEEDLSQSMRSMSVGGREYEHAADPATPMSIRNQMGSPTRSTHYTRAASASGADALIRSPYMMTRGDAAIASSSFASDAHKPNDFLFDIPARGDLPNGLSDRPYLHYPCRSC
jgi:hypothetical protein